MIIVSGLILELKCWSWEHPGWNLIFWDLKFHSWLMGWPAFIKHAMNSQIGWWNINEQLGEWILEEWVKNVDQEGQYEWNIGWKSVAGAGNSRTYEGTKWETQRKKQRSLWHVVEFVTWSKSLFVTKRYQFWLIGLKRYFLGLKSGFESCQEFEIFQIIKLLV